jgi:hypothetical protein
MLTQSFSLQTNQQLAAKLQTMFESMRNSMII